VIELRAFCLSLLLLSGHLHAEELRSRYGTVTASPVSGVEARYRIALEGKDVTTVAAEDVKLHRVVPRGNDEYIVVEKWNPGLHCHYDYLLLTVRKDKSTQTSPSFGKCHRLASANHVQEGIRLVLRSTGPTEGKQTYDWIDGHLTRR
jgi:hypothetical protein